MAHVIILHVKLDKMPHDRSDQIRFSGSDTNLSESVGSDDEMKSDYPVESEYLTSVSFSSELDAG